MARYILMVRSAFKKEKELRRELADIDGITYLNEIGSIVALIEADDAAIVQVRTRAGDWLIVEKFISLGGHARPQFL